MLGITHFRVKHDRSENKKDNLVAKTSKIASGPKGHAYPEKQIFLVEQTYRGAHGNARLNILVSLWR